MPWTFAHPVTVLPLRRLCPKRLSFAGLVIGSMIPDLGYYIHFADLARLAHTFIGSILVCLPTGFTLLVIFYGLRKPLWFLLPQPHRAALEPLIAAPFCLRLSSLLAAAASIVIGAWTHIVWDSFTHKNGWVVKHVAFLQESVFRLGTIPFPTYQILQDLSTLAGTVALVAVYFSWLRRRSPRVQSVDCQARQELWRYLLLAALVTMASIIALPVATQGAARVEGYLAIRVFLVRAALSGTAPFILLFILCSVLFYVMRPKTYS